MHPRGHPHSIGSFFVVIYMTAYLSLGATGLCVRTVRHRRPAHARLSIVVSSSDQDHFVCLVTDFACHAAPSAVV
jgi:hypothetical protein